MGITYLSKKAYEKLREELKHLKFVKRRQISKDLEHARSLGDLKENAEYHAAKESQGLNEKKIYEIEAKLSTVEFIDNLDISKDEIRIGAKVKLLDLGDKQECEYQLVGADESNPSEGFISVDSPIGRALLGHKREDELDIKIPAGVLKYRVIDISR
ncbi:MAG: transcription elongation factor GreA [Candidatus Kaelpia aquatica]|nr:transcription elongation factor GreA [Candidatus Kaelpia aquatica]